MLLFVAFSGLLIVQTSQKARSAGQNMALRQPTGDDILSAPQGFQNSAMLVVGGLHGPGQNQPAPAEKMKLRLKPWPKLHKFVVIGEINEAVVEADIQG